jgi:hypothetical protein
MVAMASGESGSAFWVNGARFTDDGLHICYCASVLGPRLGIKPATISHNIRGHLGTEKPRRMAKKTFERLFGSTVPYCGQVWVVRIPGLEITTRDFSQFRWGKASVESGDDVQTEQCGDETACCSQANTGFGIADLMDSAWSERSQVADCSILDQAEFAINLFESDELPSHWSLLPEY